MGAFMNLDSDTIRSKKLLGSFSGSQRFGFWKVSFSSLLVCVCCPSHYTSSCIDVLIHEQDTIVLMLDSSFGLTLWKLKLLE